VMLTGSEPAMLSSSPCSSFFSTGSFGDLSFDLCGTWPSAPRFLLMDEPSSSPVCGYRYIRRSLLSPTHLAATTCSPRDHSIGFPDRTTLIVSAFHSCGVAALCVCLSASWGVHGIDDPTRRLRRALQKQPMRDGLSPREHSFSVVRGTGSPRGRGSTSCVHKLEIGNQSQVIRSLVT
jgi:hypothetical protein